MVRSFDRRLESLFSINDTFLKQQTINILKYNLLDNANSYRMNEDASYEQVEVVDEEVNIHKSFFEVSPDEIMKARLF